MSRGADRTERAGGTLNGHAQRHTEEAPAERAALRPARQQRHHAEEAPAERAGSPGTLQVAGTPPKAPRAVARPQVPPNCDLTLGIVCVGKPAPGITIWHMKADERFANPIGAMQGGFIAALCDSAMGASSITWHKGRKVLSSNAELKISLMRPVMVPAELTCEARVVSGGRRVIFAEAEVTDDSGKLVAKASSTFLVSERTSGDDGMPTKDGAPGRHQ